MNEKSDVDRWLEYCGAGLGQSTVTALRFAGRFPLVTIGGLAWPITITHSTMKIGCEAHTLFTWANFTDDQIAAMHPDALAFWKKYREGLLALAGWKAWKKEPVPEERTYKVGDKFIAGPGLHTKGSRYMLAAVAYGTATLISMDSGLAWSKGIEVNDLHKITQKEFDRICATGQRCFIPDPEK